MRCFAFWMLSFILKMYTTGKSSKVVREEVIGSVTKIWKCMNCVLFLCLSCDINTFYVLYLCSSDHKWWQQIGLIMLCNVNLLLLWFWFVCFHFDCPFFQATFLPFLRYLPFHFPFGFGGCFVSHLVVLLGVGETDRAHTTRGTVLFGLYLICCSLRRCERCLQSHVEVSFGERTHAMEMVSKLLSLLLPIASFAVGQDNLFWVWLLSYTFKTLLVSGTVY